MVGGTKMKNRHKNTIFDYFNYVILTLFAISILVPFLHLLTISLSTSTVAVQSGLHLFPKDPILVNYKKVVQSKFIWTGYKNTIIRVVLGTSLQLFFTAIGAYVLSKKYFPHRSFWTMFIVFTMFFSGGLIPTYLLVKQLKLFDTYASMILPGLISAYNMLLMRNFFMALPEELEESCQIDGGNRFVCFFRIVIPVSKPILATIALWLAVGHWNAWYDVLLYIHDSNKFVLQTVLRRIILEGTQQMVDLNPGALTEEAQVVSTEGLKAASIFVATIPILCVYPFIQKYFVKGIMVGSLKG